MRVVAPSAPLRVAAPDEEMARRFFGLDDSVPCEAFDLEEPHAWPAGYRIFVFGVGRVHAIDCDLDEDCTCNTAPSTSSASS